MQRGYIEVVMDVRGTGDSNGQWGLFDPIQQQDAIKVLDWAAHLPNSTGSVGTYGPSYLGIDQLLLAGAVGKGSPLKAIFPLVSAQRHLPRYLLHGRTPRLRVLRDLPRPDRRSEHRQPGRGHRKRSRSCSLTLPASKPTTPTGWPATTPPPPLNVLSGGDEAYDGTYWQQRNPSNILAKIVANGIPAYLLGGEFDIFQNGEPLNYAALQNAYDHRPTTAPMLPGQPVTGRYQLIDGPWEHINGSSVDVDPLELEWFDTWLKGEHTGMATTPTPLHYYDLGTGNFDETTTYPFTGSAPTTMYFGAGGSLSTTAPTASTAGSDTIDWSPVGNVCGRPIDQWSMGGVSIASSEADILAPCVDADNTTPAGTMADQLHHRPPRQGRHRRRTDHCHRVRQRQYGRDGVGGRGRGSHTGRHVLPPHRRGAARIAAGD